MNNLFTNDFYVEDDINLLITSNTEESINLDFKASGSLDMSDSKKTEIAKDVSAFANSDGGIIVYGITEVNYKADSLSFIDGNIYTKEWLEQVINSRIQKRIAGVAIYPVRYGNDPLKTIYIVKIPRSYNAPHQASDKKYYKRFNFQSIPMEEYEVRDLFNRAQKTEITIEDVLIKWSGASRFGGKIKKFDFELGFQVKNIGNAIEERFKLEISFPKIPYLKYLREDNPIKKYFIREEVDSLIFSIANQTPLFQNEMTTICTFPLEIDFNGYKLLGNPGVKLKLYFSNGTAEHVISLAHRLSDNGRIITDEDWNEK